MTEIVHIARNKQTKSVENDACLQHVNSARYTQMLSQAKNTQKCVQQDKPQTLFWKTKDEDVCTHI